MRAWRWRAFVGASLIACTVYDDAPMPYDAGTDAPTEDGAANADASDAFAAPSDVDAGAKVLFPRRDCEPTPWETAGEIPCEGLPANALCGRERICSPSGECVSNVRSLEVFCPTPLTLAQLCVAADAGFAGAYAAQGYYWYQCAGPSDCPTPWTTADLKCGFCGATDCVGVPYCGTTSWDGGPIARCFTDETEAIKPSETSCAGGNPGWLLRTRCRF
jgi:hypothetical protein